MSLVLRDDGPTLSIAVSGEIDMSNAHLLTELVGSLCAIPAPMIALDLSEVRFCGARGVSALLRARELVVSAGGRLTLRDPSPFVLRVLAACRVLPHLGLDGPTSPATPPLTSLVPPPARPGRLRCECGPAQAT
ncbi:STAS domain-containing protein [Micromonospora sp. NPDC051543]|uniref:STAS domain-containing protein n=1 Tax=Micromonospora sp. NPDC051543 TaxID=3364287 RepID=UPI0037A841E4